ncbi:hypothetical protein ACFOOM_19385 [Streptomyces echinoruber]|uniref:Uncharacterized protein n=1 Tax=Streptomyces echinoruber TaxID=68898 RepID=A0A918VIF8_9ACTN|nr:hypothetical protein [Streptomyces echinoruber]GHA00050.1 hypothetical protein GCM10010389_43930 [Streptomyces echinoruber]
MPTAGALLRHLPRPLLRCAAVWRRAVRRPAGARRRSGPAAPPYPVQVRALLDVLDQAVAAQPAADAAVAACGAPDGPTGQAAQDCGRVCSAFHRLRAELHGLTLTAPDLARAQAHAGRLLAYDQWMVHQALNLAFSVHPEPRTEAARLQLNGLGRPADDLRRLRDGLRAAQGAPGPATAPRP